MRDRFTDLYQGSCLVNCADRLLISIDCGNFGIGSQYQSLNWLTHSCDFHDLTKIPPYSFRPLKAKYHLAISLSAFNASAIAKTNHQTFNPSNAFLGSIVQ